MWHEDGLYAAADVKMDMSTFETPERGEANFVAGSVEFCIWDEDGGGMGEMKLWLTCHIQAADGRPVMTNANVGMDDAPGISMAAVKSSTGYTTEVLISKEALAEYGINVASGAKLMILTDTIYWDTDFDTVECACDSPGWSSLYTYTLTDAPAGRAVITAAVQETAAEAPQQDAPANEAAAAVQEAAESAPEAPAVRAVSAPTGDAGFIYIIISAAAAVIVFAVLRKKSLKKI